MSRCLYREKKEKAVKRLYIIFISFIFFISLSTIIFGKTINNLSVITEEYVQKVIIEGKWGTNAGEFGKAEDIMVRDDWMSKVIPESLAVDSKGNIYILDIVNNRIQKFNNKGRYIKNIKVPSWKGYFLY